MHINQQTANAVRQLTQSIREDLPRADGGVGLSPNAIWSNDRISSAEVQTKIVARMFEAMAVAAREVGERAIVLSEAICQATKSDEHES